MKRKYIFVASLLFILAGFGFIISRASQIYQLSSGQASPETMGSPSDGSEEIKIVASFYPVYIALLNITEGVEGIILECLTEENTGCLHDYQLTVQDMVMISEADVFVANGGGMESFLDDILSSYPGIEIMNASLGIELLECDHDHGYDDNDHDHSVNGHVWMDIDKYMQQVDNIAADMARYDSKNSVNYTENASVYKEKIASLAVDLENQKSSGTGERVIIFHDAFAYLAEALGFEVVYTIDMDENTALSAYQVAEVIQIINEQQVDILLAEASYGTEIAETIAVETRAKVYILDPLVEGKLEADSYITGMTDNLSVIRGILKNEY